MPERIIVIGGNAAGMTAAGRAKRLRPELEVTVLEMSHFISYSICGLPYYTFGLVKDHESLITFTPESLKRERGIEARIQVRVDEILPGRRQVSCTDLSDDREFRLDYDRLVISTGYTPKLPKIPGLALEDVFTMSRLEDGIRLRRRVEEKKHRRAAVVGGGYIGLMMAHGLRQMGLSVELFEKDRQLYRQVDEAIAELVQAELERNGVKVALKAAVREILEEGGKVSGVRTRDGVSPADLVLVDVGVEPNTVLAQEAGLARGTSGGIAVDERGQTSLPGIFAAGNCAEARHLVSGRAVASALGTTAAKQGRVVGENVAGWRSCFPGTLETSIEKVFELAVARTGLTRRQALEAGFEAETAMISARDRAAYYPGTSPVSVLLVYEMRSGRLLGGQLLGGDEIAKRIDVLVTAVTAKMTLEDLARLDLAYAPPYATLWDPIQVAANAGLRKLRSR